MRKALLSMSLVLVLGAAGLAQSNSAAPRETQPTTPVRTSGPCRAASSNTAFSTERLARIDRVLQQYVEESRIAGAVALVLRDGQPVYERAIGWSDKEAGRRMTMETIFRIASQTKAITSVAI